MSRQIIIASHGDMAEGMYNALTIILGKKQLHNVSYLNCYMEETQNVRENIEQLIEGCDDELLVFTDLFGGSVNNIFYSCMEKKEFLLIAGMNLPMVIEAVLFRGETTELINQMKQDREQYIVFSTDLNTLIEEDDFI